MKNEIKDENINKVFTYWTVLYDTGLRNADNRKLYHCKCKCGNEKDVSIKLLKNGHSKSCGCYRKKLMSQTKTKDLTGQKFGRLTVIKREGSTDQQKATWICECECGNTIVVPTGSLTSGNTKSCGCYGEEKRNHFGDNNKNDLKGQRFGKLLVLEETDQRKNGNIIWKCQCDCGNITYVSSVYLVHNTTKSCGCLGSSYGELKISELLKENNIPFEKEYWFSDLIFEDTKYHARFDFYINNKYLIEFDGEQHFKFSNNWHNTLEDFYKLQEHDKIKNQYCKDNNIPLIRIPYSHLNNLCLEDLLLETSQFIFI